jgi:VWFA-related protein
MHGLYENRRFALRVSRLRSQEIRRRACVGVLRKKGNLPLLPVIRSFHRHGLMPFMAAILIATTPAVFVPMLCAQTSAPNPGAESAPATNPFVLTVNARLVVLDVVVTDKAGKPVDGLTTRDFQVFEDDKPQHIRSLDSPAAHTLPATSIAAGITAVFDPAQPASFGHSPVDVLVFDQLNTHFADSSFARRCLHDYLARQPALLPQPTTLLTVYDSHFKLLQGFTRDRDALLRAVAAAPVEYPWKLEVNGKAEYGPVERLDQSLRALEEIAQSYARIPGRKNLIWVGGGFPTINPTTIDGDDAQEVKDALQHVTGILLDTHVTLYAIDPSSTAAGMTEITDSSQAAFVMAAGDALSGGFDPFSASGDFDRLGPVTGGRVIRGRNDIGEQIASSADLGAHYYTIAYTPSSSSEAAAQYRKIRVVSLRPGLTATTRTGYYSGETQAEKASATAAYDLTTAAETALPLNGIRVTVELDSSPSAPPNTYIVHAGAANLTWKTRENGSATASVYIMAVSLNAKNTMLGHTLHGMKANAKPGANLIDPAKTADFSFTAQPLAKAATLRFIVRDNATGRMGSADIPLRMP